MDRSDARVLSDDERAQMRRWLETWRTAGPLLEQERIKQIRTLTDPEAARIACDLWRLARPGGGDDAEGLKAMKSIERDRRHR